MIHQIIIFISKVWLACLYYLFLSFSRYMYEYFTDAVQ